MEKTIILDEASIIKEKCLVTEAREKCNCTDCKNYRAMRDFMIKSSIQAEIIRIKMECLREKC